LSLKKNLLAKTKESPDAEVLYFDESRFGTHSKIGHGWFKKGTRTGVEMKLGFKNFYLYSAVSPISGKNTSLIFSSVNTACMTAFLQELSREYCGKKVVLVLDGAGWHRAKALAVPANITLMYLPPYSPELNPVERLWLYIKRNTIRNRIYLTLDELQNSICDFLLSITEAQVASICNASYLHS
jgi:transposase